MSLRLLLFLAFAVLIGAGLLLFTRYVTREVTPHAYSVSEDSLAETAALLASVVESETTGDRIEVARLRRVITAALQRDFAAAIHHVEKRRIELRVYVTDERGIVLFDSDQGRDEGRDYSRWNDVHRTLRGRYGARATRSVSNDPFTSVHYVAAPISIRGRTAGVLSVGKPVIGLRRFIEDARGRIVIAATIALSLAVLASTVLALWISRPIRLLARYSEAVSEGARPPLPRVSGREVRALARSLERMREALEGKRYVEAYVRDLAHEVKAPLSGIRAAAELLDEDVPETERRRFVRNIREESERLQTLVDRMLELSALEARARPDPSEPVELVALAAEVAEAAQAAALRKEVRLVSHPAAPLRVLGDRLLLRQALANLVHNALAATPHGGTITIEAAAERRADPYPPQGCAIVHVSDTGCGIPEYALPRVFERFYSIPPPGQERRGTGLGLAFVREVARQHGGEATLENRPEGGARASLRLPLAPGGA